MEKKIVLAMFCMYPIGKHIFNQVEDDEMKYQYRKINPYQGSLIPKGKELARVNVLCLNTFANRL